MWRSDVRLVQRVNDAGVIFPKRQVLYQMRHVYLQDRDKYVHMTSELLIHHHSELTGDLYKHVMCLNGENNT